MIVIINGAPGSGKTKTAAYLFEHTSPSAIIDGDPMLGINPQNRTDEELDLRQKNITSVARNYHESGYSTIFVAFVYMGPKYLSKQIDLLKKIDDTKVVALVPNEQTLRNRHLNDDYKREGIESSLDINNKIRELPADLIIDNSNIAIEEVCEQIKSKLGL